MLGLRMRTALGSALAAVLLLSACQWAGLLSSPSPSPTPGGEPLSEVEAKYALLDGFGPLWFCDPDFYPIAVEDERAAALRSWAEVIADDQVFHAIRQHLGWRPGRELTDGDKLAAYREWKVLRAMSLEPAGDTGWRFDILTLDAPRAQTGHHTVGTIARDGRIRVTLREESSGPACPICLARGTLISTPKGQLPVEQLARGDLVWTIGPDGSQVAARIESVGSMAVPHTHRVVHLVLADGREVWASPGHPTADGRTLGALRAGDQVAGARVVSAELVPYGGGATFDLLPAGATGAYWANGIPLGSTLTH
jgi:Hint domain-containing protein